MSITIIFKRIAQLLHFKLSLFLDKDVLSCCLRSTRFSLFLTLFLCYSFQCHLKEHYCCSDPIRKWNISKFAMTPIYILRLLCSRQTYFGNKKNLKDLKRLLLGQNKRGNGDWRMHQTCIC